MDQFNNPPMLSRPYWLSTSYNLNCLVMLSCLFQIKMPFQNSSVCYEHVVQPLISQFWRAEGSKPDSQSTTTVQNLPPKPHLGQAFVGILHAQRPTHVGEMFRLGGRDCQAPTSTHANNRHRQLHYHNEDVEM